MPPSPPAQNPLWQFVHPEAKPSPAPLPAPPEGTTCASCVWRHRPEGPRGPGPAHCHRHPEAGPIQDAWPACPAWTEALDCRACGACCAEAYHCVEVARDEPFATEHRELLVEDFGQLQLPRPGGRCVCLVGQAPRLSCRLYAERPASCRDFPEGGASCIEARRRCRLTP